MRLMGTTATRRVRGQATDAERSALWVVRRDWPTGDHEFIAARETADAAGRALRSDQAFWRRGPMRPALSIVRMSRHDFELHQRARRGCKAPDCPPA